MRSQNETGSDGMRKRGSQVQTKSEIKREKRGMGAPRPEGEDEV